MAQAFLLRGRFESASALSSLDSLDRAVDSLRRALAIDPANAAPLRYIAQSSIARADEQQRRGIDPAEGLAAVIWFVDRLSGDPADPDRVQAAARIRARLARPSP